MIAWLRKIVNFAYPPQSSGADTPMHTSEHILVIVRGPKKTVKREAKTH